MAQPGWQSGASLDDDPELRHSIRVMQQQRTTKLLLVVVGIVLGIGVLFAAVYLAYADEPESAQPSTTTR